ncbi:MAG: hypothetical protein ACXVX6_13895 [Mycobacterium sp.]
MTIRMTRQFVSAALITAAAALGYPVGAFAQPNTGEWDGGAYDQCIKSWNTGNTGNTGSKPSDFYDHQRYCCEKSGGIWAGAGGPGSCVAPPANPAHTRRDLPPGVIVQTFEPVPPSVVRNPGPIVQTFTPALVD